MYELAFLVVETAAENMTYAIYGRRLTPNQLQVLFIDQTKYTSQEKETTVPRYIGTCNK